MTDITITAEEHAKFCAWKACAGSDAADMRERAAKLMDTTPWATPNKGDLIRALPIEDTPDEP